MMVETKSRARLKIIFKAVQIFLLLAIFFFLGKTLVGHWNALITYPWRPDFSLLGLALLLFVLCGLLIGVGWNLILREMGQKLPLGATLRIYFMSEAAKYLPGKVWSVMGRMVLAEKEGVPKVVTAASIGTMLIVMTVSAILSTLATLPAWKTVEAIKGLHYFIYLVPIGLIGLHPAVFNPVVNWFLRKAKNVSFQASLRYPQILLIVLYWCALWTLRGLAIYALLTGIYHEPLPPLAWISLTGVVTLAWTAGTLSFIAPSGLGVAEVITVLLLQSLFAIQPGQAVAIAIFTRFWGIVAELINILITCRIK